MYGVVSQLYHFECARGVNPEDLQDRIDEYFTGRRQHATQVNEVSCRQLIRT
jgi:hypothetical protein